MDGRVLIDLPKRDFNLYGFLDEFHAAPNGKNARPIHMRFLFAKFIFVDVTK